MRILVTGSRHWSDYERVSFGLATAIETLMAKFPEDKTITLIHGAAPGADSLADNFMFRSRKFLAQKGYTVVIDPHPADWDKHGKAAGPIRNQEMVDLGADICVAFVAPDSRGTVDCMKRARAAGIEILEYRS
jgi:YspA, cpYpsA-related SLOG family